ncbi:MAG TPA: uL30 family ribosomal protein [Thermoplasmata archaeon]|nr:uL30 family ribosomal protein [Thermoplasmata archaeon]
MAWMIIRVRGTIHARHDIRETLEHLHLLRPNHATIVPERPEFRGMLARVQGYVTWGEAEPATVTELLKVRGTTDEGGQLAANGTAADLGAITLTVLERGLTHAPGIRPLFRLKAPTGGWRSTKKPFSLGGALGYRGRQINDLARRML